MFVFDMCSFECTHSQPGYVFGNITSLKPQNKVETCNYQKERWRCDHWGQVLDALLVCVREIESYQLIPHKILGISIVCMCTFRFARHVCTYLHVLHISPK